MALNIYRCYKGIFQVQRILKLLTLTVNHCYTIFNIRDHQALPRYMKPTLNRAFNECGAYIFLFLSFKQKQEADL